MKNLVRLSSVMAVSVMLASRGESSNSSGVEGCGGIDLSVEPYGVATNFHLYVKNTSDEPKVVTVYVMGADGKVQNSSIIKAPANGIGEDKRGTYMPRGYEAVIKSCK